ncbi:MAG: putative Se/S carrier-like protein [Clostridium fessum]
MEMEGILPGTGNQREAYLVPVPRELSAGCGIVLADGTGGI